MIGIFRKYDKFMRWSFGPIASGLMVWAASNDLLWGVAAALIVACIVEAILQGTEMILDELRGAGLLPPKAEHLERDAQRR